MATPVVAPEITVNNTPAEINAAITAAQTPAVPVVEAPVTPVTPAADQPYTLTKSDTGVEIKYKTGEVFKGKDESEAYANALANAVKTTEYARELKTKLETPAVPVVPVTPTPAPEVDPAKQYIAGILAEALGIPLEEVKVFIEGQKASQAAQSTNNVVLQFMQKNQDFPNTPQAFDVVGKYMDEAGIPLSPKGMSAAYVACVREGLLTPLTKEQIAATIGGVPKAIVPTPTPIVVPTSQGGTSHHAQITVNNTMDEINAAIAAAKLAGAQ